MDAIRARPDVPIEQIRAEYKEKMRDIGLIDTTPVNDVVGWIAGRITHRHTLDAIVIVYGDRGVGKSYACGYFGEKIDERLCLLDGTPPKTHFSIDNVRSVDPQGTLELLTPEQLKTRNNQVFIIDDASITANARSFQTQQNKYLTYVLTTARIYRHCIILNTISPNLLDAAIRSFADIAILVNGVIPGTSINEIKVYRTTHGNPLGFGKSKREQYGKYFQLNIAGERTRMTRWFIGKPSEEWCKAYDVLRKKHTDALGSVMEQSMKNLDLGGGTVDNNKQFGKGGIRDRTFQKRMDEHYNTVISLYTEKKYSIRAIKRETGVPTATIDKMIGIYKAGLSK